MAPDQQPDLGPLPAVPLLHLKLDDGAGTVATDASGKASNGTVNGAKWNSGLSFNGQSDYVDLGAGKPVSAVTALTVTAWVKLDSTTNAMIIDGTSSGKGFYLGVENGKVNLTIDAGTVHKLVGTTAIPTKIWTHVAGTYDGATMAVYIDGKPDGTKTLAAGLSPSAIAVTLGANATRDGWWLSGILDEVKVCSKARSAAEILGEYQRSAITADLVLHLRLNEGSGTIAKDASGTGTDGTVKGATWVPGKGKNEGDLVFDGVDDYVDLGTGIALSAVTQVTVMAWVRLDDTTAEMLIDSSSAGKGYYLAVEKGKAIFTIDTGSVQQLVGTTSLTKGVWHHLAATYDGVTMSLYVDGSPDGTKALAKGLSPSTLKITVGANATRDAWWFSGEIDDLKVYGSALSASEILSAAKP